MIHTNMPFLPISEKLTKAKNDFLLTVKECTKGFLSNVKAQDEKSITIKATPIDVDHHKGKEVIFFYDAFSGKINVTFCCEVNNQKALLLLQNGAHVANVVFSFEGSKIVDDSFELAIKDLIKRYMTGKYFADNLLDVLRSDVEKEVLA